MKKHIVIGLLFLISCHRNQADKEEDMEFKENELNDTLIAPLDSNEHSREETFRFDTTIIDSKVFIASQSDISNLVVINENQDTIFTHSDWTDGIDFIDFNGDGYNDILLNYFTNVPGIHDLALYVKETGQFRLVENLTSFPDPNKLDGTKYYYSYHRSGCADSDWASDLFFIEGYLAIRIGNIYGSGCDGNEKNGIFISKVKNGKLELVKEFIREPGYYDDKFDFIKKYWIKNYGLFE